MKAVVVEDSKLAREGLISMLGHFPEVDVVGDADHVQQAVVLIEEQRPDVLFLDIHMPGETGFDLLQKLNYSPKIIFTTAYSEYAIRSFEFHTIDYLLKPISKERLAQAIEKLVGPVTLPDCEKGGGENVDASMEVMDSDHRLFVKNGEDCFLVTLSDVRYFESCKNYVQIFFGNDKAFIRKSLNNVEARLPKKLFFRANRQFIINLKDVVKIEEWFNDGFQVTLSDGQEIEISRRHAGRLKELLSF